MYTSSSIKKYLDDLAARLPAPGGGSAAALSGALGTALLEMVCNFTLGNEKYKGVEEDIKRHLVSLKRIRAEFTNLIDDDVKAYTDIKAAFKTKDKKVIDKALKDGYYVCLNICRLSREGLGIAQDISSKGNKNLITDVGCGAELLNAALNSGAFNCDINLKGIEDNAFVKKEEKVLAGFKDETIYKNTISRTREGME